MDTVSVEHLSESGRVYEGWNIGAVSIKRVRLGEDGTAQADIRKHGGEPERVVRELVEQSKDRIPDGVLVTGPQASTLFALPYLPESVCIEAALRHLQHAPDLVLSLGGETFVVYCLAEGIVRNMLSSNRCAAGSGEFLFQQFGRMNLDLEAGIRAAREGHRVEMASRCSVHCKSDATHKLNKGECAPADIAFSLIADLAAKIATLAESANWPRSRILLAGGLIRNELLVAELIRLIPDSQVDLLPESVHLEAFGAAVAAKEAGPQVVASPDTWLCATSAVRLEVRPPLAQFAAQVRRMAEDGFATPRPGMDLILGLDAGSTTTKAILLDRRSGQPVAGCYLRTHGNPIRATFQCLTELKRQLAEAGLSASNAPYRIVHAAATGSGAFGP